MSACVAAAELQGASSTFNVEVPRGVRALHVCERPEVLEHRDSRGDGRRCFPVKSAGTGVTHSKFNGSNTDELEFLQMWVIPAARGNEPTYAEKKMFAANDRGQDRLRALHRRQQQGAVRQGPLRRDPLHADHGRFDDGRHVPDGDEGDWRRPPGAALLEDMLGDEFLKTVKMGDPIAIREDGTVEVR